MEGRLDMTKNNPAISASTDLETTGEQTRQGFLEFALHKNSLSAPFIEQAKVLQQKLNEINTPDEILNLKDYRPALLAASGISDKAQKYFNDEDRIEALQQLIKETLIPAGNGFRDEIVYRFLLTKGDALGGKMRNLVGNIAQQRLISRISSVLGNMGVTFQFYSNDLKLWSRPETVKLHDVKAIYWKYKKQAYVLGFNMNIEKVHKNVDINLFKGTPTQFETGELAKSDTAPIMFGELKGGIDPAGADEHWKTGNSALRRDRDAFNGKVYTSFVAAAIAHNMAVEIFKQLSDNILSNVANLYKEDQLSNYAEWIVKGCNV